MNKYPGISLGILETWYIKLFDLENKGYKQDIEYNTSILSEVQISNVLENPGSILVLKKFEEKFKEFDFEKNLKLAEVISENLMKNSKEIRMKTIEILLKFEPLEFEKSEDPEVEVSEAFTGPCMALPLLYDFEKTDIGFEFEKNKEL